jgi:hypothetical protein
MRFAFAALEAVVASSIFASRITQRSQRTAADLKRLPRQARCSGYQALDEVRADRAEPLGASDLGAGGPPSHDSPSTRARRTGKAHAQARGPSSASARSGWISFPSGPSARRPTGFARRSPALRVVLGPPGASSAQAQSIVQQPHERASALEATVGLVGGADLERPELRVDAGRPTRSSCRCWQARGDHALHERLPSAYDRTGGGAPARGQQASTSARTDISPVSSPARYGEFADSASTSGSQGRSSPSRGNSRRRSASPRHV